MYEVRSVGDGGVGVMGYNHGGLGVGFSFYGVKGMKMWAMTGVRVRNVGWGEGCMR